MEASWGPSRVVLGVVLGPAWAVQGVLEPSWGHLRAVLGPSWAFLKRPEAILGLSWGLLTLSWGGLGGIRGNGRKCAKTNGKLLIVGVPGGPGGVPEASRGHLEGSGGEKMAKEGWKRGWDG